MQFVAKTEMITDQYEISDLTLKLKIDNEVFFKYIPMKKSFKKNKNKVNFDDSPFSKLVQLNIK